MLYFGETIKRRYTAVLFILFFAGLIPVTAGQLGTLVVVGDSLSAGFQNGVLRGCQQLKGYANLVATQAASPLILPLIQDPGVGPGLSPNTQPGFRVSPGTQATNLAVPGQTVGQALTMTPYFTNPAGFPFYMPTVPEDGAQILTNLVLGYPGFFASPKVALSQVQWANALQPQTIIVWLGSNDVIGTFEGVQSGITDPGTFAMNLNQVLSALVVNNRKILIANIPDVTLLPFMAPFLNQDPTLKPALQGVVLAYNSTIQTLASSYGIPIVDIYSLVNNLAAKGIVVRGQRLTTQHGGGLFSFDDIHASDTGNAILANEFITTMNRRLGTDIPPVNLVHVAANDPFIPGNNVPPCTTSP